MDLSGIIPDVLSRRLISTKFDVLWNLKCVNIYNSNLYNETFRTLFLAAWFNPGQKKATIES